MKKTVIIITVLTMLAALSIGVNTTFASQDSFNCGDVY